MPLVPIILLLGLYAIPLVLFWPQLSRLAVILVSTSFFVSLITQFWVASVFRGDDINEPDTTTSGALTDMRYSLAAALLTPAPFLAGALAALWLFEGQLNLGLCSLLIAGVLAVIQFRFSRPYSRVSKHVSNAP